MKSRFSINHTNTRLWSGIAYVAGVFSVVMCCLLIINYFQLNSVDPVNTGVINSLVERLNDNPGDMQLREQIRELDLLARKAYFTNKWQIRTGGYLLLMSVALLVIALQMIYKRRGPSIVQGTPQEGGEMFFQRKVRRLIAITGGSLVVIALVVAFVSHKDLEKQFTLEAVAANNKEAALMQDVKTEKIEDDHKSEIDEENVAIKDVNPESISPVKSEKENNDTKKEVAKPEKANTSKTNTTKAKETSTKAIVFPTKSIKNNFPSFRGPGGNGIAYQKNIPIHWDGKSGKNILWKVDIPLHGYNSPVIWGSKLFLAGADATKREVYCYNTKTGKMLWTANAGGIPNSPAKSPDVTDDTGHAAASVATDGKHVYAIFANGDVMAVDMKGQRVWARNLGVPQNHYGHSSSLIVYKDKIIVQYDHRKSAQVMALSAKNGETLWNTPRKVKISWASPVVVSTGDHVEVILSSEPFVASYDADTGEELWKIDCMSGEVGPSVAYANGIVFALNEYASLVAVKGGENPSILWENSDNLSDVPSPLATDKYLLVATSYGVVDCFNPQTGDLLWEQEFDTGFYASPILVDGKVYLLDRKGVMQIFKLGDKYESVAECSLGEKSVCTPAFATGRVYIRANKSLYCIGQK